MKKRIANSLLLAVIVALCFCPFRSSQIHAADGNGRIYGQLLDGTNHNAPLPAQTITLQILQGSNAHDLANATTDAQGSFAFNNLATDKTSSYAIYINYQGAQYVSKIVTLDSSPAQQIDLTVYEASTSTAKLAVLSGNILLHEPNVQKGTITVSEVIDFENLDTHAYVGSLDTSEGKPNALFFSLPANVHNITLGNGFSGYQVIQVDRGFATNAAVQPGPGEFSFSYDLPYTAASYDFNYATLYPTVELSLLVPPDINVSTKVLQSQGLTTSSADDHPYQLFKGNILPANQTLSVKLAGLPVPQQSAPPTPINTTTIWLLVLMLLMLAIVGVTWFLRRSNMRRTIQPAKQKKGLPTANVASTKPSSKSAQSPMEERRQELLQELLDLDKQFEAGKLAKATYDERRSKTKALLRSLLREKETARR